MKKVLMILAHQDAENSFANQKVLEILKDKNTEVEIRNIYSLYPNFKIDVEAEQAKLIESDMVVLQFPFQWYSTPAILKQWMDDVITGPFALLSMGGEGLKGKKLLISTTAGAMEEVYIPVDGKGATVEELLITMKQFAFVTGMEYLKPIASYGMMYRPFMDANIKIEVEKRAIEHGEKLVAAIDSVIKEEVEQA